MNTVVLAQNNHTHQIQLDTQQLKYIIKCIEIARIIRDDVREELDHANNNIGDTICEMGEELIYAPDHARITGLVIFNS